MKKKVEKLKNMALAYRLACEFDYCPDDLDDAKSFDPTLTHKEFKKISEWQGNRPDEIAKMIIDEIEVL